ncbi:MAG: YadA-like family protein, partial [Psychrobacter sp.]|nr:YadA-like family protein [Psychrobacter sp.]
ADNKANQDLTDAAQNAALKAESTRQDSVNAGQNTQIGRLDEVKADKSALDATNVIVSNHTSAIGNNATEIARLENDKLDKADFIDVTNDVKANTDKNIQQDIEIANKADTAYVDSKNKVQDDALKAEAEKGVQLGESIATNLGGGAKYDSSKGSVSLPEYNVDGAAYSNVGAAFDATNSRIDNLQNDYTNLRGDMKELGYKLSAGIASSAAMENAPFVAGKYTYAVGLSHFNGESAIGGTLRRTSLDGKLSVVGGLSTNTQSEPLFKIGISGVID